MLSDRNRFLEYIIQRYNERDEAVSLPVVAAEYAQIRSQSGKGKHYWIGFGMGLTGQGILKKGPGKNTVYPAEVDEWK